MSLFNYIADQKAHGQREKSKSYFCLEGFKPAYCLNLKALIGAKVTVPLDFQLCQMYTKYKVGLLTKPARSHEELG